MKKRKGVVISSRVHPGETNSSFMMKGIIDYLLGPSLGARMLRDTFVFKIIPMLNPDGVINGNTRCNIPGVDLNRVWIQPDKKLHPSIFALKQLLIDF
jgi:murein tripeptide amidase MpaA